jgi:hypothetical protein
VSLDEAGRDEIARRAAVDQATSQVPKYARHDAEEGAAVRTHGGISDGEKMVWRKPLRRRGGWASLRQERAEPEKRSVGARSDSCDCPHARRDSHRRGHSHASAFRSGRDAPRVERLRTFVEMDARRRAREADGSGWGWCCRRRRDAAGDEGGVRDGLRRERCERVGVRCELRCCGAVRKR